MIYYPNTIIADHERRKHLMPSLDKLSTALKSYAEDIQALAGALGDINDLREQYELVEEIERLAVTMQTVVRAIDYTKRELQDS